MSQIKCVYEKEPRLPPTDQHPLAERFKIGNRWVDAVGGQPTQAEVDAAINPPADPRKALDDAEADQARVHAQTITFLNMTPAELDAWCDQNLPAGGTRTMGKVLGRLAQQAARGKVLR